MKCFHKTLLSVALLSSIGTVQPTIAAVNTDLSGTYQGIQTCPGLSQTRSWFTDSTPVTEGGTATDTNDSRLWIKHDTTTNKIQAFAGFFVSGYNGIAVIPKAKNQPTLGISMAKCGTNDQVSGFINELVILYSSVGTTNNDTLRVSLEGSSAVGGRETKADFDRAGGPLQNYAQICQWRFVRTSTSIKGNVNINVSGTTVSAPVKILFGPELCASVEQVVP